MKRKTLILGGLTTAAVLALMAWAFAPRPVPVEVATVDRGPFETTIDEEGRTRVRDRYVVAAPLSGALARITLQAGDRVRAGEPVAALSPADAPLLDARTRRETAARLAAAGDNVQRSARQVESARLALEQARSDLARSQALAAQGFISSTRSETDEMAVRSAEQAMLAAQATQRAAAHERAALQAMLDADAAGGGRPVAVQSPIDGQVLKVLQPSAGPVDAGTPLLELGDTAQLEIVAELLTTDALSAPPGTPVRIERWGGPGVLDGVVRRIEPGAFTKISALGVEEQRVNAVIDIRSPVERWRALGDGYRVNLRIVTLAEADALRVPVSAVFPLPPGADGADTGSAVFVVDQGRARQRPVGIRARNGRHAWVTKGLAAGDTVVIYPSSDVADGARVRPRGG
jgi:HlyD family secretion protein